MKIETVITEANEIKEIKLRSEEEVIKILEDYKKDILKTFKSIENAPYELVEHIFNEKMFIAGGAIRSLFLFEQPNDLDFYFKDPLSAGLISNLFTGKLHRKTTKYLSDYKVFSYRSTPNSIIIRQNNLLHIPKIQLITENFFGNPEEVINKQFDFTNSMAYYDFKTKQLYMYPTFINDICEKRLVFNRQLKQPVKVYRLKKFFKREYSIDIINSFSILKHVLRTTGLKEFLSNNSQY